ncbi:MAG: T9SS sorting signal type C domain-containing protein [Flavobacterium sp. JAD_PAG50586_2]|nr:MAG: T9SS sorting signal type C domain-containing protein [Flavobacterium sp. JAD_PAG50586_2]
MYGTATAPTLANSVVTTGSGTGSYTSALTGLSVNTRYYYRAYATNSVNTAYGSESNFYTLANTPGTLVIGTPTSTTIPVSFDSGTENSNPGTTTYAIQETGGLYVQAGGALGATAVWNTAAGWGTISVSGLANTTTYTFHTKARNGSLVETAFGATASGTTTGAVAPVITPASPTGTYNTAFSYSIIASNSPTSYAISSGTLPTGITLNTTTGVLSGTPTQIGTFNVDFTATNPGGTSPAATISITINQASQTITFGALSAVTYGDAPFALTGTASSGLTVSYASSNTSVATVSGNTVTIVGQGTTTITASQSGDANYTAATSVNRTLTVNKKNLTIINVTANNKVQDGGTTATLAGTASLVGVVSGEESNVILGGTPVATFASAAPANGIAVTVTGYTISGSASGNYTLSQPTGLTANITALAAPDATPATAVSFDGFTANWDGVTGASSYVLDVYTQSGGSTEVINQPFTWSTYSVSNGTGGNSGGWSGSVASNTFDIPVWTEVSAYKGDNCAKVGTGSVRGALTTPAFGSAGNAVLTFRAGAWDGASEQTTLLLEITGGGTLSVPSVTMVKGAFSSYTVNVTGATAATQLTFRGFQNSNSRFFIDDIIVVVNTLITTPVSGSPFSISAPTTSYNVTGLAGDTTYYYTVKSVHGSFTSGASNEISQLTGTAPVIWDGDSWTNGSGPTASIEAIIEGVYSTALSGGFTAKKLTLTSGSFTVNANTNVTVVDEVINDMTAADFVVESNANLLQGGTINNNSGNITVQRESAAIKRLDYTLWSAPVAGQGLYAFSKFTLPNRFYVYDSSNDTYSNSVGFNLTGLQYPSPLVAPNGVNGTDTANVPFVTATGYLIRVPYDHPTTATPYAGTFTGIPNTGTITLSGLTNGSYYAIGNPYPSTIDADTFIGDNGIGDTLAPGDGLYFWRKTNNASSSSYATYTTAGGVASGGDTSAVPIVPNGVIQVGEGFIVRATATSIEFNNDQRIANNDNQFLKTNLVERNRIWLNLTDSETNVNQMMVSYMTGATQDIDAGIDGRFFNDTPTALNSLVNNEEFAIQGRSLPFEATDIVPLAFKAEAEGNYSISIDHVDGLFTGGAQAIYLKDNLTTTTHNLNTGVYSFATAAGTFNNRFEIVYQAQLANPIFTSNAVVIYSQNNGFVVNSGNFVMASIKVFDIRGRLIEEKKAINANETNIKGGLSNGVLLVQITTQDGVTVTKKVIR